MTSTYWDNRQKIQPEELAKHCGKWIAFSPDGAYIVASHSSLEELMSQVKRRGEDPTQVHVDRLVENAEMLDFGAVEFE